MSYLQPKDFYIDPKIDKWQEKHKPSIATLKIFEQEINSKLLSDIKNEIINESYTYSKSLNQQIEKLMVTYPIIGYGHQPVVYHPGLIAKSIILESYCEKKDLNQLEIIIDTDESNQVQLKLPIDSDSHIEIANINLSDSFGIYMFQKVIHSFEMPKNIKLTDVQLAKLNKFKLSILEFSGESIVFALTSLRQKDLLNNRLNFLPISKFMKLPSILNLIKLLFKDIEKLVSVYNQVLNTYRSTHKIKNLANPFPNMKIDQEFIELPFWLIDIETKTRNPIFYNTNTQNIHINETIISTHNSFIDNLNNNHIIASRGMMTTFLLRVFCYDLFIHGLGGQNYDPATTLFIKAVTGEDIDNFVTVSATKLLFLKENERLNELRAIKDKQREIFNHPLKYKEMLVDRVDFNILEKFTAKQLMLRDELINGKKQGISVAGIQEQISQVNLSIRELLQKSYFDEIEQNLAKAMLSELAISSREYPYFLFE